MKSHFDRKQGGKRRPDFRSEFIHIHSRGIRAGKGGISPAPQSGNIKDALDHSAAHQRDRGKLETRISQLVKGQFLRIRKSTYVF